MNDTRVNVELVRGVALIIAMLGMIGLGVTKPELLGSAAIGGLSGVIGGYFGLSQPKKETTNDDRN